jgi:TonB family protein
MASPQRLPITLLLALVMVSSSGTLVAQEPPTLQQLLDSARKLSNLSPLRPYVLRAGVIAYRGNKEKERTGQLTIYRDRNRDRLELSLGNTQETRVVVGDRQYISPETAFFPATLLATLENAWLPPDRAPAGAPRNVTRATAGSQDAWCVGLQEGSDWRRLCFDATHPLLQSTENGFGKAEFSDYAAVGGLWFPGRAVMSHQGSTPVELHDIQVLPGPLEPTLFNVPAGSIEIAICGNQQPAKATYHFEPEFPESERKRKRNGAVSLSIVVGKEGKLIAARVMDATSDAFAHKSLEAIHQWKFQPALCADRPVNQELTVGFTFNLY